MKVTTEQANKETETKYPCIMVHKGNRDITLYVVSETPYNYQGIALTYDKILENSWNRNISDWTKEMFIPMKGRVILEND